MGLTVLACKATVTPRAEQDGGGCNEAGKKNREAIQTHKQCQLSGKSPLSKPQARGAKV
ncbi:MULTISPECIES: hypothetical protein [Cyanophyceae]|uniref:hypothetical protein n=1 Tax=Cyanophyceae TaxID=3028117 RepID=UPI0016890C60|nr:hypothetical protein [Trichocoleus sp. FACHB-40]MBD2005822.1 hypothetical protein [Trichocoleus sp. FACHB-40]